MPAKSPVCAWTRSDSSRLPGFINEPDAWADEAGNLRLHCRPDRQGHPGGRGDRADRQLHRRQEAGLTSHLPGPGAPSKVQSPTQSSSRRRRGRDFGPSALPLWFVLRLVLVFLGERMWSKSHIKKGLDQGCCGNLLVDSFFCFPSSGGSTGSSCYGFESWI